MNINILGINKLKWTGMVINWASLVAQLVKNPPAMWETWVRTLGWEDPPEMGNSQRGLEEEHLFLLDGLRCDHRMAKGLLFEGALNKLATCPSLSGHRNRTA